MMQSMKGATMLLGSMNRQMNLPALQRIAMEFERENDIMDQRQEMMDDAIDDVTGLEDEEEGEEVVNQVLDEIGVDLNNAVSGAQSRFELLADWISSLVKRRLVYRRRLCRKGELLKQLVVEARTMICKLALTACGSSDYQQTKYDSDPSCIEHGVQRCGRDMHFRRIFGIGVLFPRFQENLSKFHLI